MSIERKDSGVVNSTDVSHRIEDDPSEPDKENFGSWCMKQAHLDLIILFLSETIATGLLIFLGCMGCVETEHVKPNHLTITLGFGLAVMIVLMIFGMVSGAHLNPAVTLTAYVYKRVTLQAAFVYCIGQVLGGYLGYGLLRMLIPQEPNFCMSLPSGEISTAGAFGVEFMITVVLILVCCGVWDPRNNNHHDSVPLRFGLAVTALAMVGGPFSGGSMNPARSFGPALYNGNWDYQWLYWAAPMSAALITSVAFRMIFYKEPQQPTRLVEELPLRQKNNS